MAKATRTAVNRELAKRGHDATIEHGEGYWYFDGSKAVHFEESIIGGVCYLGHLTVEQVVDDYESKLARAERFGSLDSPETGAQPGIGFRVFKV